MPDDTISQSPPGLEEEPATLTTSDGREWPTDQREVAEKHQEKLNVCETFARARSAWAQTLAEELTTKDGHRFNFDWWDFYTIRQRYGQKPFLEKLSLTLSRWTGRFNPGPEEYEAELGKDARLIVRDSSANYRRDVKISECYKSKSEADRALYRARVGWLKEERECLLESARSLGLEEEEDESEDRLIDAANGFTLGTAGFVFVYDAAASVLTIYRDGVHLAKVDVDAIDVDASLDKPRLKYEVVVTREVDCQDLEDLVTAVTGHDYDIVAAEECGNDSRHSFKPTGANEARDLASIDAWAAGTSTFPTYGTHDLFEWLCRNGHIEAAHYTVLVYW